MNPMCTPLRSAIVIALALLAQPPANAASGQINSFSANTTTIVAGQMVDFSAVFSISTSSSNGGGSNPTEPVPEEGYQVWEVNWYHNESETVTAVQLQAGGQSFNDLPMASPGAGYTNGWAFSVLFPDVGTYTIDLSGGWSTQTDFYISTETASRDCTNTDPGGSDVLSCSSWVWSYYDNTDSSNFDSSFNPLSITIQVNAVPEPTTLAMLAGGLGLITTAARRRWKAAPVDR